MAAITKQSLLRPIIRHHNNLSSFSSNPHPINSTNPNPNSNSNSLIDVKATLKKQPSPSSFLQDIRRNLTDYRSPSSSSGNYVSFKDLLKTNVLPKINDPSTSRIRYTNQTGSTFNLFKNEKNNNNMSLLLMSHEYTELGKKLGKLRPERRKMDWFSLQELSDRMAKLKEIEDDERRNKLGGFIGFKELNDSFTKLRDSEAERVKAKTVLRLDVLRSIGGGTPSFMQDPPKEDLLEQYFHPDNMSSAEKLKLELKNVRDQFKMSESDCGSARVQVAQLTTKIKHLSTVLAKKDKHSRKGLQAMVQKRKKLLKYLRRTDWDSYSLVLSKLGLRDNPDIKA